MRTAAKTTRAGRARPATFATLALAATLALGGAAHAGERESSASKTGQVAKETTRSIGHATRDAAKAVGHGTRDLMREIGHAFRDFGRRLRE